MAELRRALEERTVVGCAQGVLMERYGLDRQAAMAELRRVAGPREDQLRRVAQAVLDGRCDPVDPGPERRHAGPAG